MNFTIFQHMGRKMYLFVLAMKVKLSQLFKMHRYLLYSCSILLHAHVKEYLPCHKLVQTWLKNPQNLNHSQCSKVRSFFLYFQEAKINILILKFCHNESFSKYLSQLCNESLEQVVRIYAHHILCPTGSYETLQEVINSCPSLSDSDRAALQKLPQVIKCLFVYLLKFY